MALISPSGRHIPIPLTEEVTTYDANSNALVVRLRDATTITYTVDALNRVATKAPTSQPTISYVYDLAGSLSQPANLLSGANQALVLSLAITIARAGRFYRETYPGGKQFSS